MHNNSGSQVGARLFLLSLSFYSFSLALGCFFFSFSFFLFFCLHSIPFFFSSPSIAFLFLSLRRRWVQLAFPVNAFAAPSKQTRSPYKGSILLSSLIFFLYGIPRLSSSHSRVLSCTFAGLVRETRKKRESI